MKTNLSSQITLTRIPTRYYRPENAFEHSVLTRLEKVPTTIYESMEEGSFAVGPLSGKCLQGAGTDA